MGDLFFDITINGPGIGGGPLVYGVFSPEGTGAWLGVAETGNGAGEWFTAEELKAPPPNLSDFTVAQNSVNLGFLSDVTNPQATGRYTITLNAWESATSPKSLAMVQISVNVIPLPGALPLMAGGLGLLGFMGWRRKRAAV